MKTLHFSIDINASKETVWNTMLGDETYRQWTEPFMKGSHFVGDWSQDNKMYFVAPDENGKIAGMVSRIAENRPYEFISIEHLGEVHDGKEDLKSDAAKLWAGGHENYTFKEKNDMTTVWVDTDTDEKYKGMFEEVWPIALQKLKELAEK